MSVLKNGSEFGAILFPTRRPTRFRCLQIFLCIASTGTPMFAQQSAPPGPANFYLNEYAKLLATLQEARFSYSARGTRSTRSEGVCAKWTSSGTVSVSAARKLFHSTRSVTSTACNVPKSFPQDQLFEVLVTQDAVMTVSSSKEPPETVFGVIKRHAAAESWSNELLNEELGLFLGYEEKSLLALSRKAALRTVQDHDINSKNLVGFAAKTDDFEIRVLFDSLNDHVPRQIDLSQPAPKFKPFGLTRATLRILAMQRQNRLPSFVKLKITREYAGGLFSRSQSDDTDFEISHFVYQPQPRANWFTLDTSIPDGTYVEVVGEHEVPHFWQDGKVKRGLPPIPEKVIREEIEAAFDQPLSPVNRYQSALGKLKLSHQHCLIIFADPRHPAIGSLYGTYFSNDENLLSLSDFRRIAVPTVKIKMALAQELAKRIGVSLSEDATPFLVITDANGKMLGQLRGRDLLGDDASSVDSAKLQAFLKQHAPPTIDARTLLADALEQARRENKRVLIQQTATWCGPCGELTEFLNEQRSIWEKDYIWTKIDERWSHADEVMKPIRKDDSGGIPWLAILDAKGKTLATSDKSDGENIGFPSHEEPDGIEHFMKMLKSTAQRLTDDDLEALKKALEKK
jgi:hypothetical protein